MYTGRYGSNSYAFQSGRKVMIYKTDGEDRATPVLTTIMYTNVFESAG